MNEEIDNRAEPWPFSEESRAPASALPLTTHVQRTPPPLTVVTRQSVSTANRNQEVSTANPPILPPLQVTKRGEPSSSPPPPPPLQVTRRSQDANTASQSDDQGLVGPPPLTRVEKGSKGLETAPPGPPPLTVVEKKAEPPSPPALEVRKRTPPPPPPLEIKHLIPVVYLLIGRNMLTEEVHLCRVISDSEYNSAKRKNYGEPYQFFANLVGVEHERLLSDPGNETIKEHRGYLRVYYDRQPTPQQTRLGVLFKAQLIDSYYLNSHTEITDELGSVVDAESSGEECVYSWALVCCDLRKIERINLNSVLTD